MKNPKLTLTLLTLTAGLTLNGVAQSAPADAPADSGTVRSAIDLIRTDIKNEKALIIAQNVVFTADEAAEFWPLYSEYNAALGLLLDERLKLISEYLDVSEKMTNEQATALADKLFDLEGKRTALKRTWFKKFSEVIPAKKSAQFFQIENQINAALDLMLMDALPLIR